MGFVDRWRGGPTAQFAKPEISKALSFTRVGLWLINLYMELKDTIRDLSRNAWLRLVFFVGFLASLFTLINESQEEPVSEIWASVLRFICPLLVWLADGWLLILIGFLGGGATVLAVLIGLGSVKIGPQKRISKSQATQLADSMSGLATLVSDKMLEIKYAPAIKRDLLGDLAALEATAATYGLSGVVFPFNGAEFKVAWKDLEELLVNLKTMSSLLRADRVDVATAAAEKMRARWQHLKEARDRN